MNVKWHYLRQGWNRIKKAIPTISRAAKAIAFIFIIIGMSVLASSYWLSWSGIIPLLASVGGMIAFWGLWIEKEADEEDKGEHIGNFCDEKRRVKLKEKIGWWILMFGILIELTTAAGLSIMDEYKEWKNNPWNGEILSVSAAVNFDFKGTNDLREPRTMYVGQEGEMALCDSFPYLLPNDIITNAEFASLFTYGTRFGPAIESNSINLLNNSYSFEFRSQGNSVNVLGANPVHFVKDIERVKYAWINIYFLPKNTQILKGTVEIVVEGTKGNVHKFLEIFPQRADADKYGGIIIAQNAITNR